MRGSSRRRYTNVGYIPTDDALARRGALERGHGGTNGEMAQQVRRFAIMLMALSMLSVALVACQATAITPPGSGGGPGSTLTFSTSAANAVSPTPTFPLFTIGAWPSNYSPGNPDTITIYVICRVQDPTMQSPAVPPNPGVSVTIFVGGAINQTLTATTGADGIATAQLAFSDPDPGVPVVVQVSASYRNQTYKNQTFFTPGATFTATPTGGPSTTPGTTPGTTPSTGP